jgi:glycosyltransferase involved in cell wall biosynthesis
MKNIVFIYRSKNIGNSIEGVFDTLYLFFENSESINISIDHLKFNNKWYNIFFNILSFNSKANNIYHITGDIHYIILRLFSSKSIITIHDIHSILKGNFLNKMLKYIFWVYLPIKISNKITVVSNFTKDELLKIYKLNDDKIKVIYNPVNPIFLPFKKKFNKLRPTILHIGTNPNKNLIRVITAIKDLSIKLVIVGSLDELHLKYLSLHNIDYDNFVNIPTLELYELYKISDIVSFPSTYEGFGLPIIEANSIGRVVITSNIASMPEIGSNAACYVDPYDIHSIRDGFLKVINDDHYRINLIQNGFINSNRFILHNIALQYYNLYNEI